MKQVELTLYSFSELREDVQWKVLTDFYDINTDHEWWDCAYDWIKEAGEKLGFSFSRKEFYFSLDRDRYFDFEAEISLENVNLEAFKAEFPHVTDFDYLETELPKYRRLLKWNCASVYGFSHGRRNASTFDVYNGNGSDWSNVEGLAEDAAYMLEELVNDFRNYAISHLQAEYDYLTSDEAITSTIQANEYWFTEDGKLA